MRRTPGCVHGQEASDSHLRLVKNSPQTRCHSDAGRRQLSALHQKQFSGAGRRLPWVPASCAQLCVSARSAAGRDSAKRAPSRYL